MGCGSSRLPTQLIRPAAITQELANWPLPRHLNKRRLPVVANRKRTGSSPPTADIARRPPPPSVPATGCYTPCGRNPGSERIRRPALPYRLRHDLPLATDAWRARLFPTIAHATCEAKLPISLFDALVVQESRYNQGAVSPRDAINLS